MNKTQLQATLAPIVAAIAGFLAGKGYFGWDAQTWVAILGGLGTFAATIWGAWAARKSAVIETAISTDKAAVVTAVANMPEVREIKLDKTESGTSTLSMATPTNVTSS